MGPNAGIIVDLLLIAPLIWGAYKGYVNGILSEIVGILHFAIAFAISFYIISLVIGITHGYLFEFRPEVMAQAIFLISFALSMILLTTAGKYLKTEIEYDFPGAWDNVIGAISGAIKYAVLISFFFWFLTAFGGPKELITNSNTYPYLKSVAHQIMGVKTDRELNEKIRSNVGQ